MNLVISKWRGRLGNNIIQLKNIIGLALYYNFNIIIPDHKYFNKRYIIINDNINILSQNINDSTDFFSLSDVNIKGEKIDYVKIFNRRSQRSIRKFIIDLFIFKSEELKELPDNILVIHIRGGDIFSKNPNPSYIVPPLSYYINIIEDNKYKNIYILSEDNKNPCVDKLIKLYPNIRFKNRGFDMDIKLILRTRNIIISYGTFVPSLLFLSEYINNIYYPSYLIFNKFLFKDVNFNKIDLEEYKKKINKWVNNNTQNHMIINYGLEKNQKQVE